KDIWSLQPRFDKRAGKATLRLLEQPRFRAGYDFLLLRAQSGEVAMELADWWTRFQAVEGEERMAMLLPESKGKKRRRGSRRSGAQAQGGDPAAVEPAA
ncbi:MAG: polynucleotide adenylyltransferase PcnB, partial [Pseudomonadota bacterium]